MLLFLHLLSIAFEWSQTSNPKPIKNTRTVQKELHNVKSSAVSKVVIQSCTNDGCDEGRAREEDSVERSLLVGYVAIKLFISLFDDFVFQLGV